MHDEQKARGGDHALEVSLLLLDEHHLVAGLPLAQGPRREVRLTELVGREAEGAALTRQPRLLPSSMRGIMATNG